jgi:hypothetical protein
MPTLASINQSTHENSSPLEVIQQLLEQCTLTERLQASAIASLSVGEAAIALHLELAKPKKINAALSSVGLVRSDINKYAKLYEKFGGAKHLFASLGASVLFTLSAPRMEVVRSRILEMNEPVDQEMVNALKKELVPAPQKKQKLNGGEWVASPGGGNRKYRFAGEIADSETAQWLSQKIEASGGQMYAVISDFKETAHELQALKFTASLPEEKVESAIVFDLPEAIALPLASLPEVALSAPALSSDIALNPQYPIPPVIAVGDRVVVTESDKGYFMHQGVVTTLVATPEIDGWKVELDNSDYATFTSNQLAPLSLSDMERQAPPINAKACEPMSLLQIEAAGGDVNEFVGLQVEVRTMSGKRKFGGVLIKFDEKNYFVKVATEEGERIADLRETWVL